MFNRYGDITKFITNEDKLEVVDNEVYISGESDYDIAIDLEGCYDTFENLKSFIVIVAKHICEMDNIVLKFNNTERGRNIPVSHIRIPSLYYLRLDYSKLMAEPIKKVEKDFPFTLEVIYIEKPDFVTFDYWATNVNDQFCVTFEYKEGKFFLRTYGAYENIPDDWDRNL